MTDVMWCSHLSLSPRREGRGSPLEAKRTTPPQGQRPPFLAPVGLRGREGENTLRTAQPRNPSHTHSKAGARRVCVCCASLLQWFVADCSIDQDLCFVPPLAWERVHSHTRTGVFALRDNTARHHTPRGGCVGAAHHYCFCGSQSWPPPAKGPFRKHQTWGRVIVTSDIHTQGVSHKQESRLCCGGGVLCSRSGRSETQTHAHTHAPPTFHWAHTQGVDDDDHCPLLPGPRPADGGLARGWIGGCSFAQHHDSIIAHQTAQAPTAGNTQGVLCLGLRTSYTHVASGRSVIES